MKLSPVFLLFHLFGCCSGLIETLRIENDARPSFLIESFGYEPGGKFELAMDAFVLMVPHDFVVPESEKYRIAFVLQKSRDDSTGNGDYANEIHTADRCFHEDNLHPGDEVFSLASRNDWSSLRIERTMEEAGFYHLFFSNCEATTQAQFNMTLTEYNVLADGTKVYLSAGQASLPTWFSVLCALFVGELVVWAAYIVKNNANLRSIHYLMTLCLFFKICTLFFEAFREHSVKATGLKNDGWTILFYIFSFLKGMLMVSVIVLIGTGFSLMKPFLTDRDKQLMLTVLVAQVLINIAMVVVDETTPGAAEWLNWRDIFHLLDMICWCMILLPIVWSIRHLREAAAVDGKAASNFARLKNFRSFYLLVVSYVYFTRIIVFLLEATLPFEVSWLGTVFNEAASLAFFFITGYLFRPQAVNPYLALGKDDDDFTAPEAEMANL
jgi:hypothetical protein